MSTFEREGYHWRETYFVMFDAAKRPSLKQVEKVLHRLNKRFQLVDPVADDSGAFESLTLLAPDDYAAIDIIFTSGEEVTEQTDGLMAELKSSSLDKEEKAKLARLPSLDARIDLLHFEQVMAAAAQDDELDEMLDPTALLAVLDVVVELTGGVGVDPQSGSLF